MNFLKDKKQKTLVSFIVLFFVMLLLKAYVVQMIYNTLGPKLFRNMGNDLRDFKPLTYTESMLLVILFRFLFH